jgi:FKBP-type peptidyl-prolyl cis-trans isomerase
MNWNQLSLLLLLVVLSSHSCKEEVKNEKVIPTEQQLKDKLIEFNKSKVRTEEVIIDSLVQNSYPTAQTSTTGIRYIIFPANEGKKADVEDIAVIDYRINLLNGEEIYSTSNNGPEKVRIGHEDIASGLHEGLLYMSEGDSALFIMPSHRAYGFTGEEGTIPQNAILIYHVALIDLE